jgi:hypothetical protein
MKAHTFLVRNLGTLGCAFALAAGVFALPGCSGVKGGGSAAGGSGGGGGGGAASNVLAVSVNSGPANNDVNSPLASVTICVPGTSNCQTIPNVLVDTGSSGLRLLSTVVTLPLLTATDNNGNPLGECAQFADNTFLWGSVSTADIKLSGEKASAVPIQIVRTAGSVGFPLVPNSCSNGGMDSGTVSTLGANGILGVGLFKQDCGAACTTSPAPNVYYDAGAACVQANCATIPVPLVSQLQNPVVLFAADNNGTLLALPAVPATGASTISGSLIFGIGTQTNNALGTAKVYTTDAFGFITATYLGTAFPQSFIDSGSNAFFFLDAATAMLPACVNAVGFYCPPSTVNFTVTNTGNNGTTAPVMFTVFNFETLLTNNPSFTAFSNIGGPFAGAFDYGLPFFYGRSVFTGIEGQTSGTNTGPYFAY